MADQCALDGAGNLLPASSIPFYESESDDKPLPAPSTENIIQVLPLRLSVYFPAAATPSRCDAPVSSRKPFARL
ncbi:hypothetical protein C8R46DRAFT_955463 [Mycena filopes]|nr:hypothetical protein C8R46DRAFT_955463 [Mycena filopes]